LCFSEAKPTTLPQITQITLIDKEFKAMISMFLCGSNFCFLFPADFSDNADYSSAIVVFKRSVTNNFATDYTYHTD
jgi:hypothetical protein